MRSIQLMGTVILVCFMAEMARAQVTVNFSGGPLQTPGYSAGYSQFTYSLTTDAATHFIPGDDFYIMNINGLFNAVAPANFYVMDNLSLDYAVFTYTGPTTGTSVTFTGFQINTSPGYSGLTTGSYLASGTTPSGSTASDSGAVLVPAASVPEPGSMSILALVGLVLLCRRPSGVSQLRHV